MNERRFRGAMVAAAVLMAVAAAPAIAQADVWGTQFETSGYHAGQNIDEQNDWSNFGLFDANVVTLSSYPLAATFGFGSKALQISNFKTDSTFADQTYTPSVADEAGETDAASGGFSGGIRRTQFKARFRIGVADSSVPRGAEDRHTTVAADNGTGSPMSLLRFEDRSGGIHVFFVDVPSTAAPINPGDGLHHVAFVTTPIAVLGRGSSHLVESSIDFNDGENNDVVSVSIDGNPVYTGKSWENYYRHDDDQASAGNKVPTVDSLLLRENNTANPGQQGKGFLLDDFRIESTSPGANQGPTGTAGPQGPTGTAGPIGTTGPKGPIGTTGPGGTNGTNGADGAPGAQGPQGLPGQSTPGGQAEPNPPVVLSKKLKPNKRRQLSLKVRCPKGAGICDGRLSVTVGRRSLGGAGFLIAGGRTLTLRITVPKPLLKLAVKKKKVAVNVFSRDSAGTASLITKKVTFKK